MDNMSAADIAAVTRNNTCGTPITCTRWPRPSATRSTPLSRKNFSTICVMSTRKSSAAQRRCWTRIGAPKREGPSRVEGPSSTCQ